MPSRPLVINKVKVWFDDGTSGTIERGFINWYRRDQPEIKGRPCRHYWCKGFNKRRDDRITKSTKNSVSRILAEVMSKQNETQDREDDEMTQIKQGFSRSLT